VIVIAENLQHDVTTRARGKQISSACRRLGSFDTKYSDLEALSWNRPPNARARRRRSLKSISLSLWKTILSSSVASTVYRLSI